VAISFTHLLVCLVGGSSASSIESYRDVTGTDAGQHALGRGLQAIAEGEIRGVLIGLFPQAKW